MQRAVPNQDPTVVNEPNLGNHRNENDPFPSYCSELLGNKEQRKNEQTEGLLFTGILLLHFSFIIAHGFCGSSQMAWHMK